MPVTLLTVGDMKFKNRLLCMDHSWAIPLAREKTVLEKMLFTHPGRFAMLSPAPNFWWPYIQRDNLAKASEWKLVQIEVIIYNK